MKKLLIIFVFLLSCKKEEIKPIVKQKDDTVLLNYRIIGFYSNKIDTVYFTDNNGNIYNFKNTFVIDCTNVYINGELKSNNCIEYRFKCNKNDTFYICCYGKKLIAAIKLNYINDLNLCIIKNSQITYTKLSIEINSSYIQTKYVVK